MNYHDEEVEIVLGILQPNYIDFPGLMPLILQSCIEIEQDKTELIMRYCDDLLSNRAAMVDRDGVMPSFVLPHCHIRVARWIIKTLRKYIVFTEEFWTQKNIIVLDSMPIKVKIVQSKILLEAFQSNPASLYTMTYEQLAAMVGLKLGILKYFYDHEF